MVGGSRPRSSSSARRGACRALPKASAKLMRLRSQTRSHRLHGAAEQGRHHSNHRVGFQPRGPQIGRIDLAHHAIECKRHERQQHIDHSQGRAERGEKKLRRPSPAGRGINRSEAIGMTSKTTIVAAAGAIIVLPSGFLRAGAHATYRVPTFAQRSGCAIAHGRSQCTFFPDQRVVAIENRG
jgi:hypothetical protein